MKDLVIVGAGKFAREMVWMIERINASGSEPIWNLLGYVDDTPEKQGTSVYGLPVLGRIELLLDWPREVWVTIPLGTSPGRKAIVGKLEAAPNVRYAEITAVSSVLGKHCTMGAGSLLCENTLCTVDVTIGKHSIVNIGSTLSHDVVVGDFVTISPGVTICGNVEIGDGCFIGAGATIIEQIYIAPGITVGAGATVVKDLTEPGTYVGVPARLMEA